MVLNKTFPLKISLCLMLINSSLSRELSELATKQSPHLIRFLAKEGEFSIYQKKSGGLYLSRNFAVKEIIKGPPQTNYEVYSTGERKKLIIVQKKSFHTRIDLRSSGKIYSMTFGSSKATLLGEGTSPKIHLKDEWVSYFKPYENIIVFQEIVNNSLSFKIKIANPFNPYFVPHRVMLSKDQVLFTDLNKSGHPGILEYKVKTKKIRVIQKFNDPRRRVELCFNGKNLYQGLFPFERSSMAISEIHSLGTDTLKPKGKPIYTSQSRDLGQINCSFSDDYLVFIKNIRKQRKNLYEVVAFALRSKTAVELSNLNFVSRFFQMDDKLLIPYQSKIYLLLGKNELERSKLGPKK